MPSVLNLSNTEARNYFLEEKSYESFSLPPYITFSQLLNRVSDAIGASPISSYYRTETSGGTTQTLNPKDFEKANYRLVGNKDGGFSWRPFEIIHPALYVALVNEITKKECWTELLELFESFDNSSVLCESIPYKSDDPSESDAAYQVKRWWTNVEQASIKTALDYQYVLDVDISDCYGSFYTHAIAWAIHGKDVMKLPANRRKTEFLGNRIDWAIQQMRHGQTNGIPQGSVLMDFIAEIILGYIDTLLSTGLKDYNEDDFKIIRYRDDYKIFTNNPELGQKIVKKLSEVLSSLGMHLNTNKTKVQNDPVIASLKEDKIFELFMPKNPVYLSKWLIQIYAAIDKYPNSGMSARLLEKFYQAIDKTRSLREHNDPEVMISVVVNLALKNPRTYPWCMAIISKLLDFNEEDRKIKIIKQIMRRFEVVPNTGLLDIWLQRVSYKVDRFVDFDEPLTRIVSADEVSNVIWDSSWLNPDLERIVNYTSIINWNYLDDMSSVIPLAEVALFNPLILS